MKDLDRDLDMEIRENSYTNLDEYQALKRQDPTLMQCLQEIEEGRSIYGKGAFQDFRVRRTSTPAYDPLDLISDLIEMRLMQGNSCYLDLEVDFCEKSKPIPEHLSISLFRSRSTIYSRPEDRVYAFIA